MHGYQALYSGTSKLPPRHGAIGAVAESTFDIAQRFSRSFYDSIYVALVVSRQATQIMADEKLANATAAYLPVKWLGALQI